MTMNDYYFYVATEEDVDLGWEYTISDLIESEFETNPDNFPDKAAKIEFLKEMIADLEECVEKVEKVEEIDEYGYKAGRGEWDIFCNFAGSYFHTLF